MLIASTFTEGKVNQNYFRKYETRPPDSSRISTTKTKNKMMCLIRCLEEPKCVLIEYLNETCDAYDTDVYEQLENLPTTGDVRAVQTQVDLQARIVGGGYYEPENVYLIVVHYGRDSKTQVIFYSNVTFHREDAIVGSYDFLTLFQQPQSSDSINWKTSTNVCIYQSFSDDIFDLVVCRGSSCATYTPSTAGKVDNWTQHDSFHRDPNSCMVTYRNDSVYQYVILGNDEDFPFQTYGRADPITNAVVGAFQAFHDKHLKSDPRFSVMVHGEDATGRWTVYDLVFVDEAHFHAILLDFDPDDVKWIVRQKVPFYIPPV
ncbi:Uncharacterised protein g5825 [Pycnogonum litorale]